MSPPQTAVMQKPEATPFVQPGEAATGKQRSQKGVCIIVTTVIVVVLIIVATTFGAMAYKHHLFYKQEYNAKANLDGIHFNEHVNVDYKNELIYVTIKQNGPIDELNALHNYDRKMLAFHDFTQKKCFLDRLDQTFDEGLKFWAVASETERNRKSKVQFEYPKESIKPEVLRQFAGDEIADHCRNVSSYWVLNKQPFVQNTRSKRNVEPGPPDYPNNPNQGDQQFCCCGTCLCLY